MMYSVFSVALESVREVPLTDLSVWGLCLLSHALIVSDDTWKGPLGFVGPFYVIFRWALRFIKFARFQNVVFFLLNKCVFRTIV